jgi:hypothetical protein
VRILSRSREAMRENARLFVVEVILPDDATPSIAKTHDINMLVLTGGRERTLQQYRELVCEAGLSVVSTTLTEHGVSAIEVAHPAAGVGV